MSFRAEQVACSFDEHGPLGASFRVPVIDAYLPYPPGLFVEAWVELYDDAHRLWDGEVAEIKPSVSASGEHSLSVTCDGLQKIAAKRGDIRRTWVKRGFEGWRIRPGAQQAGDYDFDGKLRLCVRKGATEDFTSPAPAHYMDAIWMLHDDVGEETVSFVKTDISWVLTNDGSGAVWEWWWYTITSPLDASPVVITSQSATAGSVTDWTAVLPAGARGMRLLLVTNAAHTALLDRYVEFTKTEVYSSGRTSKVRLNEAMVELATKPGLALSATSRPVGPLLDHLSVGEAQSPVDGWQAQEQLAARHSQPFNWRFQVGRTYDVGPRLWTPDDDDRVIVVGPGHPGLVDWGIDETGQPEQYVEVLFGNKDDTTKPESWPRRILRPYPPPDDNCRVRPLNLSQHIMRDVDAQAVGDYVVGRAPATIPPDYRFYFHPARAKAGLWPGNNYDPTNAPVELSEYRAVGTPAGLAYTDSSGWGGSNSPADPCCVVLDGAGDWITWGNLAQLNLGSGARSISAWVNLAATPGVAAIIFAKMLNVANYTGWDLYLNASRQLYADLIQNYGAGQYRSGVGATALALNTWYHVGAAYGGSGGNWAFYVNGVAETMTHAGATGAWNADTTAGAAVGVRDPSGTPGYAWNGKIAPVVLYPRALAATEWSQIYNAGPYWYERSLARGTATLEGICETRKGSPVPAHHITPVDWWLQHSSIGKGQPLFVNAANPDIKARRNVLTIGTDAMAEEIGIRRAELLALEPTPESEPAETAPGDPWAPWY